MLTQAMPTPARGQPSRDNKPAARASLRADPHPKVAESLRDYFAYLRRNRRTGTVLTLRLNDGQATLIDWVVARSSARLTRKHAFTRSGGGWAIQRERANDDAARHRRHLPVAPESTEATP